MFCLWWWVLLGFLSARGCQVIQDFLSLPVDEAPEVSIFPPIILKPFNMTSDLIFAPGKCSYPCPCVAAYLGSSISRWARGTSSSRATGIPLETAHKHTCTHTIGQSCIVDGLCCKWKWDHTFSPSVPGGPRSPTSPVWPSGPYKALDTV